MACRAHARLDPRPAPLPRSALLRPTSAADPDPNADGSAADAAIVGRVLLTTGRKTKTDDTVSGNAGMGGQGVLPVPNVYNGWVQNLPDTGEFKDLTCEQRHPIGGARCR